MPRNEQKRQKALDRHRVQRKHKQQLGHIQNRSSHPDRATVSRPVLRAAAKWPIRECLITEGWQDTQELVQIIVARQGSGGEIGAATFLGNLQCLGVKNAWAIVFPTLLTYEEGVRDNYMERQNLSPTDLDTVARVVEEAVLYARRLGFNPHPDYASAALLLEGADPKKSNVNVPLGRAGRPWFIAGPYDDVDRIVATLNKSVGLGNYDAMVPLDPTAQSRQLARIAELFVETYGLSDDEDDDEDEDEDDDEDEDL